MNNNLPQIKKERFFERIKNWFKRLFKGEEIEVKEPVQDAIQEIDRQVKEINKDTFRESIQIESKDKILALFSGFRNPIIPKNKNIANIKYNWNPVPIIDAKSILFTLGGLNTSPETCFQLFGSKKFPDIPMLSEEE